MLCFVVVMQLFIMNSHEVFIHIHQGCFAGTGEIVRLPQCQWSKPVGYGKISQYITTTKHSKAKTVCIFLGIYCIHVHFYWNIYKLLSNYQSCQHYNNICDTIHLSIYIKDTTMRIFIILNLVICHEAIVYFQLASAWGWPHFQQNKRQS